MSEGRRQVPAWLIGLILAVVISVLVVVVIGLLGYGDDPVLRR